MSDDKDSSDTKNNWITPTVIVAVIGLIGTLVSLYVSYLTTTRPLELAATQTAEARNFQWTLTALAPGPTSVPSATATFPPPTFTPVASTPTSTPEPTINSATVTLRPTRTGAPNEKLFCVDSRNINVRIGPGTEYEAIGILTFQDCLYFNGQNPEGTWIRISPNQDQFPGLSSAWVSSNLVRPRDFTQLPVIEPPTPTPTIIPSDTPEG
jgi:hypothetical protein